MGLFHPSAECCDATQSWWWDSAQPDCCIQWLCQGCQWFPRRMGLLSFSLGNSLKPYNGASQVFQWFCQHSHKRLCVRSVWSLVEQSSTGPVHLPPQFLLCLTITSPHRPSPGELPSSESCLADAGLVLLLTPQKVSQTCHMACLWHPLPRLGLVPYSIIQTCCGTCMLAYLHCYPAQALGLLWYNGKGRLVPFPTERLKHPNGSTQANTKSWPSLDK